MFKVTKLYCINRSAVYKACIGCVVGFMHLGAMAMAKTREILYLQGASTYLWL